MKKVKVTAYVERGKGKRNFSCFVKENIDGCGLLGYGSSAREAMSDIQVAVEEFKKMKAEEGKTFPDVEFEFVLDIGSFFDYYPADVTAFAKYIGMNASVLRQYVAGIRYPKKEQVEKFQAGVRKFANELVTGLQVSAIP
jgi:hypothetical protein